MPQDERTDNGDQAIVLPFPQALYLHVGEVAVMGARVEGALVRLLRHLDPSRLGQPHKEVTWEPTEKEIRRVLQSADPAVEAEVLETLDWAVAHELRTRRNRAVHDQYPVIPSGEGIFWMRITRKEHGVTVVGPHQELYGQLRDTAVLLLELAARLEDLTYRLADPSRRRLPFPPPCRWPAG
jgi:hypothetical protein